MTGGGAVPALANKSVSRPGDLAINGAPPAFSEPLHVGRPNVGDKELFFSLVNQAFDRKWLTNNGPLVQEFEARVARFLGVKECVAICNGTVALEIAIKALGLQGEVIVPSYTFIATAHALSWLGVTPVFADIDPRTHALDPDSVRARITAKTTGIIPVHLWGRPAPVQDLQAIADEHRLHLLFDAAHAFGCSHQGLMIGHFGRAEILSFHATKFFNTFEGGAVVTNDSELAKRMRLMRNFGFAGLDNVVSPGTNGKMSEICAAMGMANFVNIEAVVSANEKNYVAYENGLAGNTSLTLLPFDRAERNNFQYVVVEVGPESKRTRDDIVDALHAENILARKYFWPSCHRMRPYLDGDNFLPNTDRVAERVIVLPTGPGLKPEQIEMICGILRQLLC